VVIESVGCAYDRAGPGGRYDQHGQQTSPIVVDGVIYSDTPGGGVIAVNGKDGTVKWKWFAERK
jgi:outer membrane protein assembly factor BamB